MGTSYRSSASFGKRQEYAAVAKLLKCDFDVYMTLVDDQQIDCVVRLDEKPPRYLDIQIKARSKEAKYPGTFSALTLNNPRENFFFIFYSEGADCYWIMPSKDLAKMANRVKSGENKGKYHIVFTNTLKSGEVRPRPKWNIYKNNFGLLKKGST